MKINTERCNIREFLEKDIEAFMLYRNNESWMEYQGFKGKTKDEYREVLLNETTLEKGIQLAIVSNLTDELLGDIYLNESNNGMWIGYTISPVHARKGYAYEVVIGLIEWIKQLGITNVYAGVMPENQPSIQLLKKAGFKYTKTNEYGEDIYLLKV